ncbi:MAG TPA: ribosomal protein S18-alanine N-acetyltransferase [Pyrinomonadaceae bacterium]|jgi:ribosomal-protein-alanine N-acetyltransferase
MAQRKAAIHVGDGRVSIDRMTEHDLLEVVEIEQACGLSPWGWDAYHAELGQGSAAIMLVARVGARSAENGCSLAGYIVARVVADNLHVNNVAVRPELRRHGIGTRLLEAALHKGAALGSTSAWLEVRAGNQKAQSLYERCGFHVAGRRRDYYNLPVEDALIMNLRIRPLP